MLRNVNTKHQSHAADTCGLSEDWYIHLHESICIHHLHASSSDASSSAFIHAWNRANPFLALYPSLTNKDAQNFAQSRKPQTLHKSSKPNYLFRSSVIWNMYIMNTHTHTHVQFLFDAGWIVEVDTVLVKTHHALHDNVHILRRASNKTTSSQCHRYRSNKTTSSQCHSIASCSSIKQCKYLEKANPRIFLNFPSSKWNCNTCLLTYGGMATASPLCHKRALGHTALLWQRGELRHRCRHIFIYIRTHRIQGTHCMSLHMETHSHSISLHMHMHVFMNTRWQLECSALCVFTNLSEICKHIEHRAVLYS